MVAKVARWGNSVAIRIPKALLEVIGLSDNDNVEIVTENKSGQLMPKRETLSLNCGLVKA